MKNVLNSNYNDVLARIKSAAQRHQRKPQEIKLIAVSKKHSADSIRDAFELGISSFAENYLQEAIDKQQQLSELAIEWHFIGAIQSNKTKAISTHFDWVHTIDREKIARRLNQYRGQHRPPLNCCIQYNIDQETSKAGVRCDQALLDLAGYILEQPHLRLRGLMAIPSAENSSTAFQQLQQKLMQLKRQLEKHHSNSLYLDTLSMGMSADFEQAIAHGSTILRIGSALFGART